MFPLHETRSRVVLCFGVFLWLGLACLWSPAAAESVDDPYAPLKAGLVRDGFHPVQVQSVFARDFSPQYGTIAATFRLRESKLNYAQFLEPTELARARRFAASHHAALREAEATHGVDQSVIVAILLVETRFGSYTGRTPILPILASFAIMDDPVQRDRVWQLLTAEDRTRWERGAFDDRLLRRAQWAYQEICALIRMGTEQETDVSALRGSVMGAMGWAQFLPSSFIRFAYDGDSDGKVDLFQPVDAIFSVANYLRGHGWNEAKTREEKGKVIHAYNKSQPYVDTVLAIADRLR